MFLLQSIPFKVQMNKNCLSVRYEWWFVVTELDILYVVCLCVFVCLCVWVLVKSAGRSLVRVPHIPATCAPPHCFYPQGDLVTVIKKDDGGWSQGEANGKYVHAFTNTTHTTNTNAGALIGALSQAWLVSERLCNSKDRRKEKGTQQLQLQQHNSNNSATTRTQTTAVDL